MINKRKFPQLAWTVGIGFDKRGYYYTPRLHYAYLEPDVPDRYNIGKIAFKSDPGCSNLFRPAYAAIGNPYYAAVLSGNMDYHRKSPHIIYDIRSAASTANALSEGCPWNVSYSGDMRLEWPETRKIKRITNDQRIIKRYRKEMDHE